MNHKALLFLLLLLAPVLPAAAQNAARYGCLSRQALLRQMPETHRAQQELDSLRAQFDRETQYNEAGFQRQFSEFLQVQKSLSEPLLRKRQADLQVAMERALAFRREGQALLDDARKRLFRPIEERLDAAIRVVGAERGYDLVIDTDSSAAPYVSPTLSEDATPFVREKLVQH
ncbi:OmpH family outer membrane protein [Alloprevotella sp. Lung230]|nr:OmpH family outer membrane protein [Alloprevotella sp. Lung230]